ncbi:hypothetical protein SPRG_10378 [Saprolegnia parasitica CBS 223.65]|uniref:Uncharacterized protein n=1 Tax=Saprolegnia parasitica (strain CBS 223.65) TaxID=695850 RepID=A0A067C1B5_SAPPC|nr:hypothetical protein SPRG_10378 [Saprolegnia parasitica CBS 223.65]KDO24303.1 hypothetical protein SPRG_10378 [Saprolegnia parasitica CBS 223.65]|eukprot:XP_012204900.1 hypothetical protein SPRG_10378 [Saprolegnia parasitica CBS 223.65]
MDPNGAQGHGRSNVGRFLSDPTQLRDSLVNEFDLLYWFRQTLIIIKDTEMYEPYVSLKYAQNINDASFVLRHVLSTGSIDTFASRFAALVMKLAFEQVLKLSIPQDEPQQLLVDASCAVVTGHATNAPASHTSNTTCHRRHGWVSYIQTTVEPNHVIPWGELAVVHAAVKRNPKLQIHKHRLVLVMPVKLTWVGLEFAPEIDDVAVYTGVVALSRAIDYGKPEATEYM